MSQLPRRWQSVGYCSENGMEWKGAMIWIDANPLTTNVHDELQVFASIPVDAPNAVHSDVVLVDEPLLEPVEIAESPVVNVQYVDVVVAEDVAADVERVAVDLQNGMAAE